MQKISFLVFLSLVLSSCSSSSGPDKTIAGTVLGAGWGAGAGAVVGNQVNNTGQGVAIGAGFGAVSGAVTGASLDALEHEEISRQREINDLKIQVASNQQNLTDIQRSLDLRDRKLAQTAPAVVSVYFDEMRASLRKGSAEQLEVLVENIKNNPYIGTIEVHGNATDSKDSSVNRELSEARAKTVATYLVSSGISKDQIMFDSHGIHRPVSSIKSKDGAHLNRRVDIILKK